MRYRSFAEMMESAYAVLREEESRPTPRPKGEPLPEEYVGSPGSAKRRLKPRQKPAPPVEELLAALEDETLARKLFPRAAKLTEMMMLSSPGLTPQVSVRCRVIEELGARATAARSSRCSRSWRGEENWNIRQEIASVLGSLRDERTVEPLLAMLDDDSNAACAVLESLKHLRRSACASRCWRI